jgi:hypothetical protein
VRRAARQNGSSTPLGITLFALIEYRNRLGAERRDARLNEVSWSDFTSYVFEKMSCTKWSVVRGVAYFANKVLLQQNHRDITHTNPIGFDPKRVSSAHTPHIRDIYTPCNIHGNGDVFAKLKLTKLANWPFETRSHSLYFSHSAIAGRGPKKRRRTHKKIRFRFGPSVVQTQINLICKSGWVLWLESTKPSSEKK